MTDPNPLTIREPDEYSDTFDVIADLRAPFTADYGMSDEANYEISDALAKRFPNIMFDPEFSCFYAYANTKAEAEELIVAINEAVANRPSRGNPTFN